MKQSMLLFLLLAVFARIVPAQQAPAKTSPADRIDRSPRRQGAITGRVIGPDGQPVADAAIVAIRISESPESQHSTICDDDGNFKLKGLRSGAYVLEANSTAYISADFSLGNSIHYIGENLTIGLVKGGVITGRVTDEAGDPMVDVRVSTHLLRDSEGKTANFGSGLFFSQRDGVTDDRGIYRIYGLAPGVYIVSTEGNEEAYWINGTSVPARPEAPTYYPSATRDTATEINLSTGEEASGIDIRHRGDLGHIVSGKVSGENESSLPSHTITVRSRETGGFQAASSLTESRGFVIYGVPDGEFELIATNDYAERETHSSARRRISVKGADLSGIELKLAPQGSIAGRIVLESSAAAKGCAVDNAEAENQTSGGAQEQAMRRPYVEEIILRADRDEPNQPISSFEDLESIHAPNEKGEFVLKGLDAGRYRIYVNLPDDSWYIRAINQSGGVKPAGASKSAVDISRNGITIKPGEKLSGVEMIIAEDAATLAGRVVSVKGSDKLPARLRAYLIPAEAANADDVIRYAETDVRSDNSFVFKHIAPGKYLIHARKISDNEANDDEVRLAAWDAIERAKLRREAMAAKNEIELRSCAPVKDYVLRLSQK